ncbi:hypothetical protein F9L33_01175 [Amylibacter sp. SFDW26]|uniref:hypothetical protein n=1 Tax=Amylibacter sp. SFDW26 TaxID=2652722 RepID=UPI0012621C93|nr:hypothetical protein [Amylibacter sp. SFDW26]KAB7615407.1 hypothetical protein F9L33_01175 [Amylibacter sp. SFDW26]
MNKQSAKDFKNGDIYSFKTSPINKFSDNDTGRYACLKVLTPVICLGTAKPDLIGFVVLDKIFNHNPTLSDIQDAKPLVRKSFGNSQKTAFERMSKKEPKPKYAVHSTDKAWECTLLDFSYLGNISTTAEEENMRKDLRSFGAWQLATTDAEVEWRWNNDKDVLLHEYDLLRAERVRKEALEKERYETRLKHLTWEKAQNFTYFKRWTKSPPFPPPAFTIELSTIIKSTMIDIQTLGDKPSRPKVRKHLKRMITEITSLDSQYNGVIETEEREDIYEAIYDITHLSKQTVLIDEVSGWHYLKW